MKIPLRFQITEYDCGTVTLQNAMSYMFDRETIPPEIVRAISMYTLDCCDASGNIGQGGTSKDAIGHMVNWMKNYTENHDFKIRTSHLLKENVTFDTIKNAIGNKGCVVLRTYLEEEHYVLITDINEEYVYVWDPYYLEEEYYDEEKNIQIIFDKPFCYNRKITIKRFKSITHKDFALGPINNRECLLFEKI